MSRINRIIVNWLLCYHWILIHIHQLMSNLHLILNKFQLTFWILIISQTCAKLCLWSGVTPFSLFSTEFDLFCCWTVFPFVIGRPWLAPCVAPPDWPLTCTPPGWPPPPPSWFVPFELGYFGLRGEWKDPWLLWNVRVSCEFYKNEKDPW